jgi:hypothetical protein
MPRTDNYQWTISSGATFQHGTYLCGEPWVVDNGDLSIISVSPTEVIVDDTTMGKSGPTNITLLNPDNGRWRQTQTARKNINHDIVHVTGEWQWSTDGMTTGAVSGDQITTGATILNDFRGGLYKNSELATIGRAFYSGHGATFPLSVEAGDQILINTGYTGDLTSSADEPFTESRGVLTVVSSAPGASAFRPPVNWDPVLKTSRPEFLELDDLRAGPGGTANEWVLPNYNLTSDTKSWSGTSPSKFTIDYALERLGPVLYLPATGTFPLQRGTLVDQASSRDEYGNHPATDEESMITYIFDSNISGATQDLLRRTLVQRGIDIYGYIEGRGGKLEQNGGHNTRYNPLIFLAWCVTGNTGMYNYLNDNSIGTAANGSYHPQQINPHGPVFGTYSARNQEHGHVSWNNDVCSFRHFDVQVLEQGTADNLHFVKVSRPLSRTDDVGTSGNTYGNIPLWHSARSSNSAGGNWGRSNNAGYVDYPQLWDSAYIRIKGQSGGQPYSKITRVVDSEWYDALGSVASAAVDKRNPTSGKLFLMDNVIPEDGGITGADICACLVNTRPSYMNRHVTYEFENTATEAGYQAYQYAAMCNALNNWKLVEIKGGTANVPEWGKNMHKRSVYYASDIRGKAGMLLNWSSTYSNGAADPESSLFYAMMRQGPGGGASLPHVPYEYKDGYQTKPGSGTTAEYWRTAFAIPYDATWEEIKFDLSKIRFWTTPRSSNNPSNFYRYTDFGGGSAGTTYTDGFSWVVVNLDDATAQGTLRLRAAGGVTHGLFNIESLGLVPWLLPRGTRTPYKLQLDSSNAADDADTIWDDYYSIVNHPPASEELYWGGSVVFWADDTALTPGSGFASSFNSDYDNTARFGQSVVKSEYVQSATMDGSPRNEDTYDNFARTSYPVVSLGQPNIYSATADFDLDIYTFHGAGIKEVEVVADGGTPVLATLVEGANAVSPLGHGGHYRVPIEIKNGPKGFTPGTTSEIRVTSKPYNGYDRTVQFRLSAISGENKVVIDPSSTIASAYDTVLGAFDETKRNLVELSVSGGYTIGVATVTATKDYGYVEVSPAAGVSAEIDLTFGGNNASVRPLMYNVKWDSIAFKNFIVERAGWTASSANTVIYLEDNPRTSIWWSNNCSFTSNWVTGTYNGLPYWQLDGVTQGGVVPQGMDFFRNSYSQQLFYTNCIGREQNNGFGGALLVNGCTQDYCYQDSYTNVKACINSASTNKITPAYTARHADHYQLFYGVTGAYENTDGVTFESVALVQNFLLYGYYGQDINTYVQQFGFFGTGNEYYSDIAHANCFWTGATSAGGAAQIGIKYDHVLCLGLTSENGPIVVRSDGVQYGPVLMKNISATYISNGYQTPLNNPLGATNEFRERGTLKPAITYSGTPTSDALLQPYYQWHVSPVGLTAAGLGNIYAANGQLTDGTNLRIPVTATGMTTGYPDIHTAIAFGRGNSAGWVDTTRLAYTNFSNNGTTFSSLTMTPFVDNAEAVAFEQSGGRAGWWLKVETDQGYAYPSSSFSARASGGIGDWVGYNLGVMGSAELHYDGITSSATGITFTLMKLPE